MDVSEVKHQLKTILRNLPPDYSMSGARKLMASFENYKRIVQGLPNSNSRMRYGIEFEFEEIEGDIKVAIIGVPKKEAELKFRQGKERLAKDINSVLAAPEENFERG